MASEEWRGAPGAGPAVAADPARALRRSRSSGLAFLAFLLLCAAVAAFIAHRLDADREDTRRDNAAQQAGSAVDTAASRLEDAVRDLAGLYAASRDVSASEFTTFARSAIEAGAVSSLSRIDLVDRDERRALERRLGRRLWVLRGDGRPTTAPDAETYAVVVAVEDRALRRPMVGYDAFGGARLAAALRRAAETGEAAASPTIVTSPAGRAGIAVFVPRYVPGASVATPAERTRALRGWAAGAIDDRHLTLAVAPAAADGGIRVSQSGRELAEVRDVGDDPVATTIEVAGSDLRVEASGPDEGVPMALWTMAIGLLAVVLTGLLLRQHVISEQRSGELAVLRARERDEAVRVRELERTASQAVFGHLPDHGVYRFDANLRLISAAGGLVNLTGLPSAALLGRGPEELVPPDVVETLEPAMRSAIDGTAARVRVTVEGHDIWVDTAPLAPGEEGLMVATDVTGIERERAGRAEAEARFAQAFLEAPVGIVIADLDGRYVEVNRALCEMLGYGAEELRGESFTKTTRPEDIPALADALESLAQGEVSDLTIEARGIHANGDTLWVEIHASVLTDRQGRPEAILCQMVDVSDRRRFEARLQHMADHDPLTGLANRRSFERALDNQLANVRRYGPQGALIVVDLDHFKAINDTLGHTAGDAVILNAARILRELLRESDILARLGGDEFAILLPRADRDEAIDVARRLVVAVRAEGSRLEGQRPGSITASVGVTLLDPVQETGEQALVDADLAMYDAKEAGRDGFSVFDPGVEIGASHTKARLTWLDRVRQALEEDRLTLVAQPIQSLTDERVVHHELLLRMVDDDGNLIAPGDFLHIAERFGLIGKIDTWVARRAIRVLGEHADRDLVFEVNLSGPSIGSPEILQVIEQELRDTEVDPQRLIFEITETAAVANVAEARAFAERLGELGCRFALDDFGAGFGSFYYLKHLPCDFLKIDGEFIRNLRTTPTDQVIVAGLVRIAHGLGKQTIAEFVGDEETVELLRREGVDMAQGYHVGRPEPLAEALARAPQLSGRGESAP